MDSKVLGKIIRDFRKRRGLTQAQFAHEIKISVMSVRRYENGERVITDDVLQKIIKVFNLPDDYFEMIYLTRTTEPHEDPFLELIRKHVPLVDFRQTEKFEKLCKSEAEKYSDSKDLLGPDSNLIEVNVTPDPEWVYLYSKLEDGSITPEELKRFDSMNRESFANARKAIEIAKARLSFYMGKLNEEGLQKAIERVEELTEIPKYQKNPENK